MSLEKKEKEDKSSEIKVVKFSNEKIGMDVDFYPSLFSSKEFCKVAYKTIKKACGFSSSDKRRYGVSVGSVKEYVLVYRGEVIKKKVLDWKEIPIVKQIKDVVEGIVGVEFSICIVMFYPNGKRGIKPHRDKEITDDSLICGISFGQERQLLIQSNVWKFSNGKRTSEFKVEADIKLGDGSMYVLNPPTNDVLTHCITEDKSLTKGRISLTFRNYKAPDLSRYIKKKEE